LDQNPALWSLGYEWALYLFAPAIINLIMWKASFGLRLTGIVLACAIAATICTHPEKVVFWFLVWFLGAGSYHLLRAGRVSLPLGLLGACLMIVGMAMARLKSASGLEANTLIAAGTAPAIACRPMVEFRLAPRFFSWAAGFSYTLYAIHIPLVYLMVAIFQSRISTGQSSSRHAGLHGVWDYGRHLCFGCLPRFARDREKNSANPCSHAENVPPHGSSAERYWVEPARSGPFP
jgi:peptidoglycan/LPS O-acetylase OafA/YrhL